MNEWRFTCETSTRVGNSGKLKPDADGYYTMIVGQLDAPNLNGAYYDSASVKKLFESDNAQLLRQLRAHSLYGENGHPKRQGGQTDAEFLNRNFQVIEENACVFFKEIWLDYEYAKKFPGEFQKGAVVIFAKLKPGGEKARVLKELLDDPDRNICFSIRCMAEQKIVNGRPIRYINEIITFDLVIDPGMQVANRYLAPYAESASILVTREMLQRIVLNESPVFTEDAKAVCRNLLSKAPAAKTPAYLNW